MTREDKIKLLNTLLEIEEKNDVGNLTRAERGEFQSWVEELQESFKPMVEIDLYSVIKQKYIEREVLDKIRAEIKQYQSDYDVNGTEYDRTAWKAFNRCLQILDKYKAESEGKE